MNVHSRIYINIRRDITVGVAGEMLKLALTLAKYKMVKLVLVPSIFLHILGEKRYPKYIYSAITSSWIDDSSFFIKSLHHVMVMVIDVLRFSLIRICGYVPLGFLNTTGCEYLFPVKGQNVPFENMSLCELKKIAKAARGFGNVDLSEEIRSKCKQRLVKLGIKNDDWFVCLHVRTSVFHSDAANYRNSAIENYELAVRHIIENGGYVVRVGDALPGLVRFEFDKFVDYPNTEYVSEVMDLYLVKECKFYIGTASGLLDVAYLFKKPVLSVNSIQFDFRSTNKFDLVLYKNIYYIPEQRILSFHESVARFESVISDTWQARFRFIENTSDQILTSLKEFMQRLESNNSASVEQVKIRRKIIRRRLHHLGGAGLLWNLHAATVAFARCNVSVVNLQDDNQALCRKGKS